MIEGLLRERRVPMGGKGHVGRSTIIADAEGARISIGAFVLGDLEPFGA